MFAALLARRVCVSSFDSCPALATTTLPPSDYTLEQQATQVHESHSREPRLQLEHASRHVREYNAAWQHDARAQASQPSPSPSPEMKSVEDKRQIIAEWQNAIGPAGTNRGACVVCAHDVLNGVSQAVQPTTSMLQSHLACSYPPHDI